MAKKPNRNRDMEFVIEPQMTKADLFDFWGTRLDVPLQRARAVAARRFCQTNYDSRPGAHDRSGGQSAVDALTLITSAKSFFWRSIFALAEWTSLSVPRNRSPNSIAYLKARPGAANKEQQLAAVAKFVDEGKDASES